MKKKLITAIKKFAFYYFNLFDLRGRRQRAAKELFNSPTERTFNGSKLKVVIFTEGWNMHVDYIKACNDLNISYRLVDIFSANWLEQLNTEDYDLVVFRPSVQYAPWKDMFDNRIRLLSQLGTKQLPDELSLWLWESKLRTVEFLKLNEIPAPKSSVFYLEAEANHYVANCSYPVVYKSNIGSGSSGVKILKSKAAARRIIRQSFNKGIRTYRKHKLDAEHGSIMFQEYLPNVKEWRVIRIGRYYFGFEKIRVGKFHSGSQTFGYGMPPENCLGLVKDITDRFGMHYVDIDVFIDEAGDCSVNEIQPYFGQMGDRELLEVNGNTGRLMFKNDQWVFEQGEFCVNNLCNLRLSEYSEMST